MRTEVAGIPAWKVGEGPVAVMVIQEIFGLTPYIEDVCGELAKEGFLAVAPEVFHHEARGTVFSQDDAGMAEGRRILAALDRQRWLDEAEAVRLTLGRPTAVLGFCAGGMLAWEVHGILPFMAGISFYGRLQAPGLDGVPVLQRTAGMKGPALAHFGGKDTLIPAEVVGETAAALMRGGVRGTVEVWPQAGHAFHNHTRSTYCPTEASAAWKATLALLRTLPT